MAPAGVGLVAVLGELRQALRSWPWVPVRARSGSWRVAAGAGAGGGVRLGRHLRSPDLLRLVLKLGDGGLLAAGDADGEVATTRCW